MITVIVPISPIKSHPETSILEETIQTIRHHLPDAEILLTFDGVRKEQSNRLADYEEHIYRILWLADHHWGNIYPFIFNEHMHQTGMMREILDKIDTQLIMYVEQDTPLVTDEPIDWQLVTSFIESGEANLVRFYHEAYIMDEHRHMMHGGNSWPSIDHDAVTMLRTSQWSQRPHVAARAYYRRIMDSHFTPKAKSFIEDRMYGIADQAFNVDGMAGWNQHRLHIYHPDGGNIKRSVHRDGRAGESKWDAEQIF